jgi:hypothetical protein
MVALQALVIALTLTLVLMAMRLTVELDVLESD